MRETFRVQDERALATIGVSEAAPRRVDLRRRPGHATTSPLDEFSAVRQFMIFNWRCCKELINATVRIYIRCYITPIYCCSIGVICETYYKNNKPTIESMNLNYFF